MRGGMYGVGEAITPGALTYGAAYTGPVDGAGNAVRDPTDPAGGYTGIGGRRYRRRGGNTKPMAPPPPPPMGPMDTPPMPPAPPAPKSDTKGGRKTRKGKKSRKGGKKSRRKMRGGAGQVSMGTVGYGYTGTGAGGLADATQYTTQGNAY